MATYLDGGWYASGDGGLRTEVIDAAMDIAGVLLRAGIAPAYLQQLALTVRTQMTMLDPQLRGVTFGEREHEILGERLMPLVDRSPELATFLGDCIDAVKNARDFLALYLHLVHVSRMMQLLAVALNADKLFGVLPLGKKHHHRSAPRATRRPTKPAAKKKAGKKAKATPKTKARTAKVKAKAKPKRRPARPAKHR